MSERIFKERFTHHFGTKGLHPEDLLFIEKTILEFGGKVTFTTGDWAFQTASDLISYCKDNNCPFAIIAGHVLEGDPTFKLCLGGSLCSWEVSFPIEKSPERNAVARQLFTEVKQRLEKRSASIPDLPWKIARNGLVWIPAILLAIKAILPDIRLDASTILQITIITAFLQAAFSWTERKRWNRQAIVEPSSIWRSLNSKWAEIWLIVLGAFLSAAFGVGLSVLSNWITNAP